MLCHRPQWTTRPQQQQVHTRLKHLRLFLISLGIFSLKCCLPVLPVKLELLRCALLLLLTGPFLKKCWKICVFVLSSSVALEEQTGRRTMAAK